MSAVSLEEIEKLKRLLLGNSKSHSPIVDAPAEKPRPIPRRPPAPPVPKVQNPEVTYEPIPYTNAAQWLKAIAPELSPHVWQYEELMFLSGYRNIAQKDITRTEPTKDDPILHCLKAANGSGKDQFIIAGFATFYAAQRPNSRVVITTASHQQLKTQTEPHIASLCRAANKRFGFKMFDSVQHRHSIPASNSRIELFVTDDEGKAEGYHPDREPGSRMALIINEAKSIAPEIFKALGRCTGYSHWLEVSSPGLDPVCKDFERDYKSGVPWGKPYDHSRFYSRTITGDDCPHLSERERQQILLRCSSLGELDPYYRMVWKAEFVQLDSDVCIPSSLWRPCDVYYDVGRAAGLDIGAGRDETILTVRNGNRITAQESLIESNLMSQVPYIEGWLNQYSFTKDLPIYADDNGVGAGLVNRLQERGWNVTGVKNQSSANDSFRYANLGAESYFNVRRLVEQGFLPIPTDDELFAELTSRTYLITSGDKRALTPKHKLPSSPNKADSFVLAHLNLSEQSFYNSIPVQPKQTFPFRSSPQLEILRQSILNHARHAESNNNAPPRHRGTSKSRILRCFT